MKVAARLSRRTIAPIDNRAGTAQLCAISDVPHPSTKPKVTGSNPVGRASGIPAVAGFSAQRVQSERLKWPGFTGQGPVEIPALTPVYGTDDAGQLQEHDGLPCHPR